MQEVMQTKNELWEVGDDPRTHCCCQHYETVQGVDYHHDDHGVVVETCPKASVTSKRDLTDAVVDLAAVDLVAVVVVVVAIDIVVVVGDVAVVMYLSNAYDWCDANCMTVARTNAHCH